MLTSSTIIADACTYQVNSSITVLDLSWNVLGPQGGEAISKAIEVIDSKSMVCGPLFLDVLVCD
jgi:hypothetical protein